MAFDDLNRRLGVFALAFAGFLVVFGIPNWVYSPSNIQKLILSPLFWPYVLAGLLALVGLGLLFVRAKPDPETEVHPSGRAGWRRLMSLAIIMVLTMLLLPRLGMVWTSMLAFVATAGMLRTRYPKAAIICAIIMPLVLYAFFAHVAGVAIPQGHYVRLP